MNIILNGAAKTISSPSSLLELLEQLGFEGKPVVVEHNKLAIFTRDYADIQVSEGDKIEIISIAAGG